MHAAHKAMQCPFNRWPAIAYQFSEKQSMTYIQPMAGEADGDNFPEHIMAASA